MVGVIGEGPGERSTGASPARPLHGVGSVSLSL